MKTLHPYLGIIIISLSTLSCITHTPKSEITHLAFCDVIDSTYLQSDTLHLHPFQALCLTYLVNEKNTAAITDSMLSRFIQADPYICQAIAHNYPDLSIMFYKASPNTKLLANKHLTRYLSACNDDILVEFIWSNGKPSGIRHYKNGHIDNSHNHPTL